MSRGALVDRCDRCGHMLVKMQHAQHALVQAVYEDMAEQLDFPAGSGGTLTPDEWHQVMVDGYAREKGWTSRMVPALDGSGYVMLLRTKQSRLTRKQGDELLEFCRAYALGRGARLREFEREALAA